MTKSKLRFKRGAPISIRELLGHLNSALYTRQTLVNLFRTFLENVIEERLKAVVLMKIDDTANIESVISRLNYAPAEVFVFNTNNDLFSYSENFNFLNIDSPIIDREEFLVVLSDKFSATIYWSNMTSELYGLFQGAWSFNPGDARYLAEYLDFATENPILRNTIENVKADRRYDERYTSIMTKLIGSLENRQRDLICANKELKELHDKALQNERLAAIGQVSSVIAHELRNPLGLIDLYAKLLLNNLEKIEIEDPEQKEIHKTALESAQTIKGAASSFEKILSELLDYSKPLELEKEVGNLKALIDEVCTLLKPTAQNNNIEIKLDYNVPNDVNISFDKIRIGQALINIIKNAVEISPPGKNVKINVNCRSSDGTVYIKVVDEGPGLSEESLNKLFTPYFSTKAKGTGLGLAQAKKIMKAHNGDIELLSSTPGNTIFALIIPGKISPIPALDSF